MNRTLTRETLLAAAFVCVLAGSPAFGTPTAQAPLASEQVGGTILNLTPRIAWESAVLRVSGPNGYALTRRFSPGTPISADLLTEAEPSEDSSEPGRYLLPDGRYRYEVVFTVASGEPQIHRGQFFVENGAALGRRAKRAALQETRRSVLTEADASPSEGLQASAYLSILDSQESGQTWLRLESFDFPLNDPDWSLYNSFGDLQVREDGVVRMEVAPGGRVGIGTTLPEGDLHLGNVDGNGDTVFKIARSGTGSWNLGHTATGVFTFNKSATGGQEFTVRRRNHSLATLDVQGHVRGTTFKNSSSRELKTAFEAVDPAEILAAVSELPITSWRYRDDATASKHIGPVAEDFQRLFDIGDGKTISTVDSDGVLLAALQGLNAKVDRALADKQAEIDDLREQVAELTLRLEAAAGGT